MKEIHKRVLAGVCLAPPIVIVFYYLPREWFLLFLALVSALAVLELVKMAEPRQGYLLALLAIVCLVPLYRQSLQSYVLWLLFSPVVYLLAVSLSGKGTKAKINGEIMTGINTLFLSEVFVVLPLFYFYFLKGLGNAFPLILLFTIWASDTGAYIFGKNFGKRPLVPLISPKKTYEGLAGAMVGSMIVMAISSSVLGLGILEAVLLGMALGFLGQAGDIFESIWKRVSNVKDSSSLIPGHGGILDRIDSFIFTAPLLYHYLAGLKV